MTRHQMGGGQTLDRCYCSNSANSGSVVWPGHRSGRAVHIDSPVVTPGSGHAY